MFRNEGNEMIRNSWVVLGVLSFQNSFTHFGSMMEDDQKN